MATRAYSESWPRCFTPSGIMPCNLEMQSEQAEIQRQPAVADLGTENAEEAKVGGEMLRKEGEGLGTNAVKDKEASVGQVVVEARVAVFTDWACRDNQFRALRRAGIGGFWADGHRLDFGEPLGDGEQTNN